MFQSVIQVQQVESSCHLKFIQKEKTLESQNMQIYFFPLIAKLVQEKKVEKEGGFFKKKNK